MKSWKKQLRDELNRAVPALKNEILNAPIISENNETSYIIQQTQAVKKRKISIGFICVATAIVITFIFLAVFGVFNPTPTPAIESFIFVYEINPKIAFITDKNGLVSSINALNADADVILSNEETINKLKHIPISESIVIYSDIAAKLGYINLKSDNNAVRLSTSKETSEEIISDIDNKLTDYFRKNGIYSVVLSDIVSPTELSTRMNLTKTDSINELTNMLQNLSVHFGERINSSINKEDLNKLYENYVICSQMFRLVQDDLLNSITQIIKNADLLYTISTLNMQIMTHNDNPSALMKDYWSVIKIQPNNYSEEFASLIDKTTEALNEYKTAFNTSINSIYDLMSAVDIYSAFNDQDLNEVITALSSDNFLLYAPKFLGMLKNIGYDITNLTPLLSTPQTIEEYIELTKVATKLLYDDRLEKYLDIFNENRAEITEIEYSKYLENIESQYGSLTNYWNNK